MHERPETGDWPRITKDHRAELINRNYICYIPKSKLLDAIKEIKDASFDEQALFGIIEKFDHPNSREVGGVVVRLVGINKRFNINRSSEVIKIGITPCIFA